MQLPLKQLSFFMFVFIVSVLLYLYLSVSLFVCLYITILSVLPEWRINFIISQPLDVHVSPAVFEVLTLKAENGLFPHLPLFDASARVEPVRISGFLSAFTLQSSEVIDFRTNRKRVYDFLMDLDNNPGPILPRFRDIRATPKATFDTPSGCNLSRKNWRGWATVW